MVMHIAASLMSVKARWSCHCTLPFCSAISVKCECMVVVQFPGGGGGGGCHLATVPEGVAGDHLPWVDQDKGGGGWGYSVMRSVTSRTEWGGVDTGETIDVP